MLVYLLEKTELDTHQKRIVERSIKHYKERGINLPEEKQTRLKEINTLLSDLHQKFSNNVLDSELEFEYFFTTDEKIKDMPEDDKSIAAKRAEEKGKK